MGLYYFVMKHLKKIALLFYVLSLSLPAFEINGDAKGLNFGIACLIFGWILFPTLSFWCWTANFGFLYLVFKKPTGSGLRVFVGVCAILLALMGFFIQQIPVSSRPDMLEAEVYWGYYFWLTSMIVLLVNELQIIKSNHSMHRLSFEADVKSIL